MEDKQTLFLEMDVHLMEDKKPSEFFNMLNKNPTFKMPPFDMLYTLADTPQSEKYHPEGSVWNHTMLVMDEAAKRKNQSENSRVFMWSALLHDIGKGPTTEIRKGRITSYDHDKVGTGMSKKFLSGFTEDEEFIQKVSIMVRWHMQPLYVLKNLPYADITRMNREVSIEEIALFSICDRLGRGGINQEKTISEHKNTEIFLEKCEHYLYSFK